MPTTPNLTLRQRRQVELVMPHRTDVSSYDVWAADTLNVSFSSGGTSMFQVRSGMTYRSPGIRARGLGRTQYTNRGLTRATYDPQDYWTAGTSLPYDGQQAYLRVSEISLDGTARGFGPILVVPSGGWLRNPRPAMSLSGTAPNVTLPADGTPPPDAMHIILPYFGDNLRIQNLSTTDPLYIGFRPGAPLIQLGFNATGFNSETLYDAAFKELFLCGDGAAVDFDIRIAIVNGEMA